MTAGILHGSKTDHPTLACCHYLISNITPKFCYGSVY